MKVIETYGPQLALIGNPAVRESVLKMLLAAPEKSWSIPSSSTGKHHAKDENTIGGNVLHTKRVVAMVCMLAPAFEVSTADTPMAIAGVKMISRSDLDLVIAAALIHDILKQGTQEVWCSKAEYNMHGPNLFLWHEEKLGAPDYIAKEILDIASRHMGVWSKPSYRPNDNCSRLLAMADYVASREDLAPAIKLA